MVTKESRPSDPQGVRVTAVTEPLSKAVSEVLHVQLIEDDVEISQMIVAELREAGFGVNAFCDGEAGLESFLARKPDLLLLDLNLPGIDGLEVCQRIRASDRFTPIFMLTARATKADIVQGLELGADEYLTKPFSGQELIARMRALLRRVTASREHSATVPKLEVLQRGSLRIGAESHEVHVANRSVALTTKEFDLLLLFARNPGRTFSRSELLTRIWGPDFEGFEHTVNTHINRLRSKIESETSTPRFVETVWGMGYRFAVQPP